MDKREFHLQPMGICYRLYHYFTKALALQASKTVTLGRSGRGSSSSTAVRRSTEGVVGDSISSVQQAEEKNKACMNVDKMEGENGTLTLPTSSLAPTRSIKKTVSICENVEVIPPPKKLKRKWSGSFQKSMSLDQEEEPMPPPRSILKSNSFS